MLLTAELLKPISYGGIKRQPGDRLTAPSTFINELLTIGAAKLACNGNCPIPEPEPVAEPEADDEPKRGRPKRTGSEASD